MRIMPQFIALPLTRFVDLHLLVEGFPDHDALALGVIQDHDQNVGHFTPDIIPLGVGQFSDFTIELDEHRRVLTIRERAIRPVLDHISTIVDIHD